MNYVHRFACECRKVGISVIPLRLDGSKGPGDQLPRICNIVTRKVSTTWLPYQTRIAELCEIESWFSRPAGIGIVCGAISGGLEVIDFDVGELFEPWHSLVSHIVDRLPVISTPSNGWHIYYRCDEIGGNIKIACDPKREKQTLIETRGQGGYVVGEGSPCEVHATGLPYCHAFGPFLPRIPRITPDERRQLWAAARTFDLRGEVFTQKLIAKQTRQSSGISAQVHPVIASFNDRHSWDQILSGWTTRDGEHWTRPGKQFGVSARIVTADDGSELLTVFSGNAGPLSPDGSYRTWNKFDAWAAIQYRGDNRAAFIAAKQEVTT